MYDVVALGELLIDFTTQSTDADGYPTMAAHPGGAPANFLAAVAQFGGGLKASYAFLDVHGAPAPIGVQFPKAVVDDAHKLVRVRACFSVIGLFPVVCLGKAVQQGKGFPIVLLDTEAAQVAVP